MLKTKQFVSLSNLINDCVVMVHQAGQHVQKTSQINAAAQPATARTSIASADHFIRQTYLHNLSQLFPGITLVCQGEKPTRELHYAKDAFIQPDELLETRKSKVLTASMLSQSARDRSANLQHYAQQFSAVMEEDAAASMALPRGEFSEELPMKDVAVWIDPIDGSKAFAEGKLEHVTNMIGITVKGRPVVGIIHKPFTNKRRNSARTYVGSLESGLFFFDHSKVDKTTSSPTYVPPFSTEEQRESGQNGAHFQPQMCFGTSSEQEHLMEHVFQDLMPLKVNRVKGAGNKFLHMANERSDFFMNFVPSYSMWDLCASEAIFSSRLGILTDARQKPLFYDSTRRSFGMYSGVVAARNSHIYLSAKRTYEAKSGSTLAKSQTEIRRDIHLRNQESQRRQLNLTEQ